MRRYLLLITLVISITCNSANAARWMKVFNQKLGGPGLQSDDISTMAKFDLLILHRSFYDDVGASTWNLLRKANPNQIRLIYIHGGDNHTNQDCLSALYNNAVARYATGAQKNGIPHSMGSLKAMNPHLILWVGSSGPSYCSDELNQYVLMDFGYGRLPSETDNSWYEYLLEAVETDIVKQEWAADGVYLDNCSPCRKDIWEYQTKYRHNYIDDSPDSFPRHMNWFLDMFTGEMHTKGQLVAANRTKIQYYENNCDKAWDDLDDNPSFRHKVDFALEEGAFFHNWGGIIRWWPELRWKAALDVLADTVNYSPLIQSRCSIDIGDFGTDQRGHEVSFWDAVWFNLTSYALGMHSKSFIGFDGIGSGYREQTRWWFEEYDYMDEGKALHLGESSSRYRVSEHAGYRYYWREFEKGYVYVNPNDADLNNLPLPKGCKRLSHANFKNNLEALPTVNTIDLLGHTGAILRKASEASIVTISPPTNLRLVPSL